MLYVYTPILGIPNGTPNLPGVIPKHKPGVAKKLSIIEAR